MIRTLFIEDNASDVILTTLMLKKDGIDIDAHRVDSVVELSAALEKNWDLILSDFNLPGFNAFHVLKLVKDRALTTPLIILSSEIRDEIAVELMHNGAVDFVRKDSYARLAPAIRRELQAARDKVDRENQFHTLANSIPQLAWMAKADGRVFWYNKRWYDYTGITFEEIEANGWRSLQRPDQYLSSSGKWRRSIESGQAWQDIFELRSKTGEYRWFLSRALPLRDGDNKVTSWFGTNTDITEQLENERELKLAKQAAEQASLAKTRFLANMSHEIRTPLGVMMGFAELALEQGKWSKDVESCLHTIRNNGLMLTQVIGEVLDLARIEASKIQLEVSKFDVAALVSEICAFLNFSAIEKGIRLNVQIEPDLPRLIETDPIRLRQILMNLIGNAIKFTEKGEVSVSVTFAKGAPMATTGILKFTVTDTGIGIPAAHRAKLFEPFSQADESMTRKYGGSGLGLALSKELAKLLNGDIVIARSDVGVGTTFVFSLGVSLGADVAAAPDQESPSLTPANTLTDLSGISILLVEDSIDNQLLFSRFLKGAGAKVDFAANGQAGVEKAFASEHDIILMDIQMPVLTGHEATAEIRRRGYSKPIIALTAHSLKEEREQAMRSGFNAFLTKPIDKKALLESVARHVQANHTKNVS